MLISFERWSRNEGDQSQAQPFRSIIFYSYFSGVFLLYCAVLCNTSQLTLWYLRCDFSLILLAIRSECSNPYRHFYFFAQMWRTYAMVRNWNGTLCSLFSSIQLRLFLCLFRSKCFVCFWFASSVWILFYVFFSFRCAVASSQLIFIKYVTQMFF